MNRDRFDLELLQYVLQLARIHRGGDIVFKDKRRANTINRGISCSIG